MRLHLPPQFAMFAVGAVLLAIAALTLYIPADWVADLGPPPDALEYAVTGKSIAHGGPYSISLLGHLYPPRYPFGFPALIAPAYWLPGATLANGIYSVGVFGALTIVLVYRLTVRLDGQLAGVMAGAILLLLPQYLSWNQQVMSETASAALTVIAALLLYAIATGDDDRQRGIRLTLLGLICGLAILVHITNVALLLASFAVLLLVPSMRKRPGRALLAPAAGPLIAIVVLGGYDWKTFGRFTRTGYAYWVPEWYGSLGKEFSVSYAFTGPGIASDPFAPAHTPNVVYYLRALAALPPHHAPLLLWGWSAALTVIGLVSLTRRPEIGARAVLVFISTFFAVTLGIYSVYFFQTIRFLAPITPFSAVLAGIGARSGAGMLKTGVRVRRPIRVLLGAAIVTGTVLGLGDAVRAVLPQTYLYRADVSHESVPIQGNSWTASLYRRYARKRSIIITDTLLPFLDDQGVTRIARIVPVTRGEYWNKPPLLRYPRYADRYRAIDRALRDGTPVYTDAPTFNAAFINRTSDPGSWHALASHRLVPVGATGPDIVYRLEPRS